MGLAHHLFVAHLHCYIILVIRQYPKVAANLRSAHDPLTGDLAARGDSVRRINPRRGLQAVDPFDVCEGRRFAIAWFLRLVKSTGSGELPLFGHHLGGL